MTTLCSDEFQGRLTGSPGNKKAEEYIKQIFKDIGLEPFFSGNYCGEYSQDIISNYGLATNDSKIGTVNNIAGLIKGNNNKNAVIISCHFDHIGYQDGKIVRGALDNASGVSAVIKIANTLKEKSKQKPFNMDIVVCSFNGEEEGLAGSRAFVKDIKSVYNNLYNINIDSICSKHGGNLALKNKSKISTKLNENIKNSLKKCDVKFSDTSVVGTGDHMSFERAHIPNILIVQENIEKLLHKHTDTPENLNLNEIDKIANAISFFVEENDGVMFNESIK